MIKQNIKKLLKMVCFCSMLFVIVFSSTACANTKITKEKLLEVNNTSKILDQYQTITIKSNSTYEDGSKTITYTSYHKDVNNNIVIQSESKSPDGKFKSSTASFDGLSAIFTPGLLLVSFVICDNWNTSQIHQFNTFSKNPSIITEDIKNENGKFVVKTSNTYDNDTLISTHYFNEDTYLIEKTETIATNTAGETTFQGVDEFYYGKQIINNSSVYQILSIANGNFTEVQVNYVDSNESKICYINKNARIFGTTNYDDDSEYKIYLDSECTLELLSGTILDNTNALWIKKVTE